MIIKLLLTCCLWFPIEIWTVLYYRYRVQLCFFIYLNMLKVSYSLYVLLFFEPIIVFYKFCFLQLDLWCISVPSLYSQALLPFLTCVLAST